MKKMTGNFKRWLSLLMSVVMVASQLQLPAMAAGSATDQDAEEVVVSEEKGNDPVEDPEIDPYLNVVSFEADPGVNIVWINATFDQPLTPIGNVEASEYAEDYYPGPTVIIAASTDGKVDEDVPEHTVTAKATDGEDNEIYQYFGRVEHLAFGYDASYLFELNVDTVTTFHYRLALDLGVNGVVYLTPDATFTTQADKEITSDFTDPVFLSYVKGQYGIAEDAPLKSSHVERETNIEWTGDEEDLSYIKNISGIENFKSLLTLTLNYHSIKDISPVKSLRYLSGMDVQGNDIRVLPDLSEMTYLGFNDGKHMIGKLELEYNIITSGTVTANLLPASYLDGKEEYMATNWQNWMRWPSVNAIFPRDNTYFQIGSSHPILVQFDGLRSINRSYLLTVSIGDKTYGIDRPYTSSLFIINNEDTDKIVPSDSPVEATITLKDNTNTVLWTGTRMLTFKGDVDTITHQTVNLSTLFDAGEERDPSLPAYVPTIPFANGENWGMVVTGDWTQRYEGEEERTLVYPVMSAIMVDEDGEEHEVGIYNDGTSSSADKYEKRYVDLINNGGTSWSLYSLEGTVERTVIGTISVSLKDTDRSWLVSGNYTLKVTKEGDDQYTTFATITVTEGDVVESLSICDEFDNSGEYIYVYALGEIADGRKAYPTLYLDGAPVTAFDGNAADSTFNTHYGTAYKLLKTGDDDLWDMPHDFTYGFSNNTPVNAVSYDEKTISYDPLAQGTGDYATTLSIAGNAERSLTIDATETLTATHTEPQGDYIYFQRPQWTSSNREVVSVEYDRMGSDTTTVKAVGEGEAWVTVTYGGLTAYVKYTVSAVDIAEVTLAGVDRSLDNRGDSIYLYVNGKNIDTEKIWPVIKSADGTVSYTTTASATVITDATGTQSCLYTVKKGENWSVIQDAADDAEFLLAFEVEEGYKWTDSRDADDKTVEGWELKDISPYTYMIAYYNCRKKALEVFGPAADFAGKEFTISTSVVIKGADNTNVTEEASGSGKFDANGRALVTMKDADDNVYVPSSELGFADYSITVQGMEKYESPIYNSHPWEYGAIREMTAEEAKAWGCVIGVSRTEEPEVKDGYVRFYDGSTGPYTVEIYELARRDEEPVKEFTFTEDKISTNETYTFTETELEGLSADEIYYVVVYDSTEHSADGTGFVILPSAVSKITLTYDKGSNGTGDNVTETVNAGEKVKLKAAIFTREGYSQTGWSTTDGGNKQYDLSAEASFDKNTTLYPVWEKAAEPDPNTDPEPAPEPAADAPVHFISVVEGAKVTDSKGTQVKNAKENETLNISWEAKADYDFVKWEITGATAKDPVSANTVFVMGKEDVIVSYVEKLKVADKVLEELPADADKTTKMTSLKFKSSKLTMQKGTELEYAADAKAAGGELPKIYYVTENKEIVAVDENGKFYATGVGETTVTAYAGNKKAKVKVTVVCSTSDITILDSTMEAKEVIEMKAGETEPLTVSFNPYNSTDPRKITWKTSDKKVATINKGVVTAKAVKAVSETEITATYKATNADGKLEKKTKTIKIRVIPAVAEADKTAGKIFKMDFGKKSISMTVSESNADKSKAETEVKLSTRLKDYDLSKLVITAESTNNDVVSVNEVGAIAADGKKANAKIKIEAKSSGTAYIVVKTKDPAGNISVKRFKVKVTSPAKGLVVKSGSLTVNTTGTEKTMTLRKGVKGTINVTTDPADSTDMSKITITGKKGVTVKDGVIYAKKATKDGTPAVITVKCGKLKEIIKVTIR